MALAEPAQTVSLLPMKFETEIKKTSPGQPVRSSAELAIDYADDDHGDRGDEERLPPGEPTRRWRWRVLNSD